MNGPIMFSLRGLRNIAFGLLLVCAVPVLAAESDWQFDGVDRIVAVSDVHGAYDALETTLRNAGVIDSENRWSGGGTHLVIVGDMLDRGPDSRRVMDLMMALEPQADEAGGSVHVLIGNHEAMNLVSDLRYVSRSEYAAFADEENTEVRDYWFAEYMGRRAGSESTEVNGREAFDRVYPAGYFAHRKAFASDGVYGAWLLTKPIMVVINGTAFVHGGVSPMVGEIGLTGVNEGLRGDLIRYVHLLPTLYAAGALLPTDNFYDHQRLLEAYVPPPDASEVLLNAIRDAAELSTSDVHSPDGPLWYRGNASCSALVEADRLEASLEAIGADRVVIGHTPTDSRRILERYGGTVVEVDTGMYSEYYRGSGNALVIEGDRLAAVNQAGGDRLGVPAHPRRVGRRPAGVIEADAMEILLANGNIVATTADPSGVELLRISDGKLNVDAVFTPQATKNRYPDVAAYRIDRLLGLDMVPVTVKRRIGSVDGSVRFRVPGSIDDRTRVEKNLRVTAQCPFEWQVQAMFVFDALINNAGRFQTTIRYSVDNWQLFSVEHGRAFGTGRGFPPHIQLETLVISDRWRDALRSMTDDVLADELGELLDNRQIAALERRRDSLLELGN